MKLFKQEKGHTLLELVIVLSLIGVLTVVLWTSFLSINRTYIRADKKAQNLEEARLIINHITDNFQTYERCRVWVVDAGGNNIILNKQIPPGDPDPSLVLDGDGFTTIKEVIFTDDPVVLSVPEVLPDPADPAQTIRIKYIETVPGEGKLTWEKKTSVEIESEISSFKVRKDKDGDLLEFKVGVIKKGHGVIADQLLDVGTTLNLKYMPTI